MISTLESGKLILEAYIIHENITMSEKCYYLNNIHLFVDPNFKN